MAELYSEQIESNDGSIIKLDEIANGEMVITKKDGQYIQVIILRDYDIGLINDLLTEYLW